MGTLLPIIPAGTDIRFEAGGIQLNVQDLCLAKALANGARDNLRAFMQRIGASRIVIGSPGDRAILTPTGLTWQSDTPTENPMIARPDDRPRNSVGSYGASQLRRDASPEAIDDFIQGMEHEGYVVTVTSLKTGSPRAFKPLYLNGAQVRDRADADAPPNKRWTISDWLENGFLSLWRDSFIPGRHNYFAELLRLTHPNTATGTYVDFVFYYLIRRPSGALAEYETRYISVDNYHGFEDNPEPARIGISRVGDWRIIQDAEAA